VLGIGLVLGLAMVLELITFYFLSHSQPAEARIPQSRHIGLDSYERSNYGLCQCHPVYRSGIQTIRPTSDEIA